MIKILTIIGARPQIIKAAAISRAISNKFNSQIKEFILHTGQHYDTNMSQVFFDELGIPQPDYNLGVGSGGHGEQTAKMISGIEQVLLSQHFDGVILYGDTNSTLAGAVAASKLHIPIFHIEAGLRSYDLSIPEEINRIVSDQLASISFVPTENAFKNMQMEGFDNIKVYFKSRKERKVVFSGDVMYDNSMYFASIAENKSNVLKRLQLRPEDYILCTIHRDNNTDNPQRLSEIFTALIDISDHYKINVCLPIHPRTKKLLSQNLDEVVSERLSRSKYIKIIPPVSFFDIIMLEKNAKIVMTDSGGVQKEAFFFGKPCVIFLNDTPWKEIIQGGAGIAADANKSKIIAAYDKLNKCKLSFPHLFGSGNASELILEEIVKYINK